MSATAAFQHDNHQQVFSRYAWLTESLTASATVTVKHRTGPIVVKGTVRLVDISQSMNLAGDTAIGFTIDTVSISRDAGPWIRSSVVPLRHGPVGRFESTRVEARGMGSFQLHGLLTIADEQIPVALELRETQSGDELQWTVQTTVADHRRLGLWWIPIGPLKAPTEILMTGRLDRAVDTIAPSGTQRARPRRRASNNRYSFMGGSAAAPTPRAA